MSSMHAYNPFSKREEHGERSILAYKVLTIASWLLFLVTSIHFAWNAPDGYDDLFTIWGQNKTHPSPFSLNPTIVDVYWIVLLVMQVGYVFHLFTGSHVTSAANVGSHFIVNNVLLSCFVVCWVHARFFLAEIFLVVNFFNLSSLYFRHSTTPLSIHLPIVSGPLAWNFVALFWCGAAMFGARNLPARIIANLALWGWLGYGLFFLLAFKDYTMGFNLSVLSASLGVHQFLSVKTLFALQWIFAFIVMALLFTASCAVAVSGLFGKEISFGRGRSSTLVSEDRERQPLLNDA